MNYLVETGTYRGGMIFVSERTGAFFFVDPGAAESVRRVMTEAEFKPWADDV